MNKKTLVFGASLKQDRYSNMAVNKLINFNHEVVAFGMREGSINGVNIVAHGFIQHEDSEGKRGGVPLCDQGTALNTCAGVEVFHSGKSRNISWAATSPEMSAGGTPGPGTVSWPVYSRFFTFLLRRDGFRMAVCISVLARP